MQNISKPIWPHLRTYVSHSYCVTKRTINTFSNQHYHSLFSCNVWPHLPTPPPVSPAFCSSTSASLSPLTASPDSISPRLNHSHFPQLPTYSLTFSLSKSLSFYLEYLPLSFILLPWGTRSILLNFDYMMHPPERYPQSPIPKADLVPLSSP